MSDSRLPPGFAERAQLDGLILPALVIQRVSSQLAWRYRIIPIRLEKEGLLVATDAIRAFAVERAALARACRVEAIAYALVDERSIETALRTYYPKPP
jgi:hypothetical protein